MKRPRITGCLLPTSGQSSKAEIKGFKLMEWPLVLRNSAVATRNVNRRASEQSFDRSRQDAAFGDWAQTADDFSDSDLLRRYLDGVARMTRLLDENSWNADAVLQQSLMNVSKKVPESSSKVWIFRIAVSTIQARQRWWKRLNRLRAFPFLRVSSTRSNPGESIDDETRIRHGLRLLPRRHQLILVLRDIEGMSYGEISEVLDLPITTVKSRLSRARSRMLSVVSQTNS
jgi:RNA polymerase sigma-70 factor (ECF subfamily)